jgi:hypothetical protein
MKVCFSIVHLLCLDKKTNFSLLKTSKCEGHLCNFHFNFFFNSSSCPQTTLRAHQQMCSTSSYGHRMEAYQTNKIIAMEICNWRLAILYFLFISFPFNLNEEKKWWIWVFLILSYISCAVSAYNWKKWCVDPCCLFFYL